MAFARLWQQQQERAGSSGNNNREQREQRSTGDWTDRPRRQRRAPRSLHRSAAKPTAGGDVTFALEAETTGGWCLPEAQLAISGIQVARAIYDYLTVPDDKGNYVPVPRRQGHAGRQLQMWTIHLRSGIKFHDGTAARRDRREEQPRRVPRQVPGPQPLLFVFVFDDISDVKVVDNHDRRGRHGRRGRRSRRTSTSTAASASWRRSSSTTARTASSDMIGTGPFKLKSWQVNDHLTVVKNPDYWRKDTFGQQLAVPRPDHLQARSPTPRRAQRLQVEGNRPRELRRHHDRHPAAPARRQERARSTSPVRQVPEVSYTIFNTSKEPFNNINARKAFVYAIDHDTYNHARNERPQRARNGPFGPGVMGYLDDTGLPSTTSTKAKAEGREVQAGDRQGPQVHVSVPNDSESRPSAKVVVDFMKAAGMTVSTEAGGAVAGHQRRHRRAATRRPGGGTTPASTPTPSGCGGTAARQPAAVAPAGASGPAPTEPRPVDNRPGPVGNNCDNLVNFSKFNDPVINKAFETGRTSSDRCGPPEGLRGHQQGVREADLGGVGLLLGLDGPVPDRTCTACSDRSSRRPRRPTRSAPTRSSASRAAPTSRHSG